MNDPDYDELDDNICSECGKDIYDCECPLEDDERSYL